MLNTLVKHDLQWDPFYNGSDIDAKNAIHIFKINIHEQYARIKSYYKDFLTEEELDKADRFLKGQDKERYIVTRYSLRSILSEYTLTKPQEVRFYQVANKKPAIAEINFNLSHSQNYLLIATSPVSVGIDIEFINQSFMYRTFLQDCFDIHERAFILNSEDFYLLWTRKEAVLKASGEGLTDDLYQLNCLEDLSMRNHTRYLLKSFQIDKHYIMSLATEVEWKKIYFWNYLNTTKPQTS
jgi:4'-phosphopantetheinyl transferase